jgi:predicted transcriptional regulator of viral defense system
MAKLPLAATLPNYLTSLPPAVYTVQALSEIIYNYAKAINTRVDCDPLDYIHYYVQQGLIQHIVLRGPQDEVNRYTLSPPSPLALAGSLKSGIHFSHRTAAWLHGLIPQDPATYYVAFEVPSSHSRGSALQQESIDTAFAKAQRQSGTIYTWEGLSFVLLRSLETGSRSIETREEVRLTCLERTLLEMTMRPAYSGGPVMIVRAYKAALSRVSVKNMIGLLKRLELIYPYHQSIGFYLSRAGYQGRELTQLARMPRPYRFYLDYGMQAPLFDLQWNVYYPQALDHPA